MAKEKKEEVKPIAPKMRIQLLGSGQEVISDRLVDQKIELTTGPKYTHEGPVRLEVTITNKDDGDLVSSYLVNIAKDKPELEKGTRGRKPSESGNENVSPREDVLQEIEEQVVVGESQDKIIKTLRKLGYVFLLTEDFLNYFPDFKFEEKHIGKPNHNGQYPVEESYQWMVRCIKRGKDPKVDKYDPQLIFGFKLLPKRKTKFVFYLFKEYKGKLSAPIPEKNALTFQSFEMIKFPHYMTPEEREKWGKEHRIYESDPEKVKSKFYLTWLPEVILPKKKKKESDE